MLENGNVGLKRWHCAEVDDERRRWLAREAEVSPVVAGLLLARGVQTADEALRFLRPDLGDLHDPFLIPGMEEAVERIAAAVRGREKILVHGDYDVDGVTA